MNNEQIDVEIVNKQSRLVANESNPQAARISTALTATASENELKSLLINNEANLTVLNEIERVEEVETTKSDLIAQSSKILSDVKLIEVASESQMSTKSSDTVCRICHVDDTNQNEDLMVACKCKGSLKYVHESCLLKWLTYNRKNLKSN